MNDIETLSIWKDQKNYLELVQHYIEHPIALYTGSGVSWSDDPKFGIGS